MTLPPGPESGTGKNEKSRETHHDDRHDEAIATRPKSRNRQNRQNHVNPPHGPTGGRPDKPRAPSRPVQRAGRTDAKIAQIGFRRTPLLRNSCRGRRPGAPGAPCRCPHRGGRNDTKIAKIHFFGDTAARARKVPRVDDRHDPVLTTPQSRESDDPTWALRQRKPPLR